VLLFSHRDLKPENLLMTNTGDVKIADFGMAQLMKKDGILKTSCGSPHYASPEVIAGESYDAKCTDVWSIGVILYALITGSLPFDHDNIPTLLTMVTRGRYTTPAHVPADIAHLISRMLTVDPTKRITIPEIKKHISFKGHNYFPACESAVDLLLNRRSFSSHPDGGASHGVPPHKKQRQTRISSIKDRSGTNGDADDSDEGEAHDSVGHTWRKRGGVGYEPVAGPPAVVQHALSVGAQPLNHRSRAVSSALTAAVNAEDDDVDDAVLNDLESLGLGTKESNREKIRQQDQGKEPSLELRFYRLLRQRKMDRLRELAVLSPKISPIRPHPHSRHHKPSSHHYSQTARPGFDQSFIASQPASGLMAPLPAAALVCSSQPVSQLSSPTEGHHNGSRGMLVDLQLPPPATRTSPTDQQRSSPSKDTVMSDVQSVGGTSVSAPTTASNPSGTSILNQSPTSPSNAAGMVFSSIFAPAMAAASNLASSALGLGANRQVGVSTSQQTVSSVTTAASAAQAGGDKLSPKEATASTSQSSIAANIPVAGGQGFNGGVTSVSSPSPTPTPSTSGHPSTHPPVLRHFSDGSVPASVMNDEPTAGYYGARMPPSLSLTVPPPSSSDAVPVSFSPDDDTEDGGSSIPSHDSTAPHTPVQQPMSSSFPAYGESDPKPSPTDFAGANIPLEELPHPSSSSANVSPLVPHQPIYERRMSMPTAEGGNRGVARQLFAGMGPMEPRQVDLDHFGRPLSTGTTAAGPMRERMELDFGAQSAPMLPLTNFSSPPLLELPPRMSASLQVNPVPDSSGSDTDRLEGEDVPGIASSALLMPTSQPAAGSVSRFRAYSQDESNLEARLQRPSDGVVSNVRTPISTPQPIPNYSTSPRFHRVHFHSPELTGTSAPNTSRAGAAPATSAATSGSTRGGTAGMLHTPPSPTQKKSWFSSVFGNGVSFFDRLKGAGKRSTMNNASPSTNASNLPPSPNMAPSTPRATGAAVITTKRATLTLTNELGKLFHASGVQFVHSRGYRMEASYQPNAPKENFATPPPPPPLMQRALSTPGDDAGKPRPRSSSIAVDSSHRITSMAAESASAHYAAAASHGAAAIPSTPKPTPTRSLNQPFSLQSVPQQYPSLSASPVDADPLDLSESTGGVNDQPMIDVQSPMQPSSASSVMQSPPSLMQSPPMLYSSPHIPAAGTLTATPRSVGSQPAAMFGLNGVRFTVDIQESASDTRVITLTRKSGDVAAFQAIVDYIRPQLHA
jgi:hypothetical protein